MPSFMTLPKEPPVVYPDAYPLFTRVSIETTKTCTRSCWFCPSEQRGPIVQTMTDELYKKICDELKFWGFNGVVQWFYINEPLIDPQWESRLQYLRQCCPKCSIHLTTNWDRYWKRSIGEQVEVIGRLFEAGVNSLNLNDYDDRGYAELIPDVRARVGATIDDHTWKRLRPSQRIFSVGPLPDELHTWSGYNDIKELEQMGRAQGGHKATGYCARPHRHLVVQYDGRVPLCCAVNPVGAEIFGDVSREDEHLYDIWNSYEMFEYRKRLQSGERSGQCEGCNSTMAFPHIVRKVELG